MNAIVHRNYHINAPIKVAVFQNRIEIFSPGDFPGLLSIAHLTMGNSYMRNLAIVTVFRQMGYIEKLGSGVITIFSSYQREGLPQPQIIDGENYVKVVLPRPKRSRGEGPPVEDTDLKPIVDFFETVPELSKREIMDLCSLSRATVGRRLEELVKKNILQKTGKGPATRYREVSD